MDSTTFYFPNKNKIQTSSLCINDCLHVWNGDSDSRRFEVIKE